MQITCKFTTAVQQAMERELKSATLAEIVQDTRQIIAAE